MRRSCKVFRFTCKTVTYCNRDCQKSDWQNHRAKHKSEIAKTTCSSTNRNSTKKQKKQKRKTKKPKVPKDARERIASMKWHYWSDTYTNRGVRIFVLSQELWNGWMVFFQSEQGRRPGILRRKSRCRKFMATGIWELSTEISFLSDCKRRPLRTHAIGLMNTTFYNEEV